MPTFHVSLNGQKYVVRTRNNPGGWYTPSSAKKSKVRKAAPRKAAPRKAAPRKAAPRKAAPTRRPSQTVTHSGSSPKELRAEIKNTLSFIKEKFNKGIGKAYWRKDWEALSQLKKARLPYALKLKNLVIRLNIIANDPSWGVSLSRPGSKLRKSINEWLGHKRFTKDPVTHEYEPVFWAPKEIAKIPGASEWGYKYY